MVLFFAAVGGSYLWDLRYLCDFFCAAGGGESAKSARIGAWDALGLARCYFRVTQITWIARIFGALDGSGYGLHRLFGALGGSGSRGVILVSHRLHGLHGFILCRSRRLLSVKSVESVCALKNYSSKFYPLELLLYDKPIISHEHESDRNSLGQKEGDTAKK